MSEHDRIVYHAERAQPYTCWCGPWVVRFVSTHEEALRWLASHDGCLRRQRQGGVI